MNVLLLSDPPHLRDGRYYVPLAVPLINGYFADRGDVHITHRFVHDDGAIEGTADLDSFDLIGYSCLVSKRVFQVWSHVRTAGDRFCVGGPGVHLVKDTLRDKGIGYFDGFGEWWLEDALGIPRNPNVFLEQRALLTPRLMEFLEDDRRHAARPISLLVPNGHGCLWNKCRFCHFKLSTIAQNVYHRDCIFKPLGNLAEICRDVRAQLAGFNIRARFTSFDMSPDLLERTAVAMDGILPWSCFLRPRRYPEGLFQRIRSRGFLGANVGVEVAHDEGLKLLNKGTMLAEIEWTLKELHRADPRSRQ